MSLTVLDLEAFDATPLDGGPDAPGVVVPPPIISIPPSPTGWASTGRRRGVSAAFSTGTRARGDRGY